MPRLRLTAAAALLVAAAAVTAAAGQEARQVPQSDAQFRLSFAPVVERTAGAVVNVYATRVEQQRQLLFSDPLFQRFFGEGSPFSRREPRTRGALGSGVIVDPAGIIVTNHHLIQDASDIRVSTNDGREYAIEVILDDPDTDLAVLRIANAAGRRFPSLEFGDSDTLQVGDLVLAIGNPFGVGQTVTSGIVSGLARAGVGVSDFQFFIQTDAAINPGNSGGALVDMDGRLVGINTAIYTRSGGSMGIGFAIPANMVRFVAHAAETQGEIVRPWVGVTLQRVTSDIADSLSMAEPKGAMVSQIVPDSPADRAGLADGDVIVGFDGHPIESEGEFGYRLSTKSVGEEAHLEVLRMSERLDIVVPMEAQPAPAPGALVTISGDTPFAGATAATVSPSLVDEFDLKVEAGVVIVEVAGNSPAARLGLRPGDVMVALNGVELNEATRFEEVASAGAGRWSMVLRRGNSILSSSFRG